MPSQQTVKCSSISIQIAAEKIEQSASPKREDNSEVVLESGHDAGSELSHEVAKKMVIFLNKSLMSSGEKNIHHMKL